MFNNSVFGIILVKAALRYDLWLHADNKSDDCGTPYRELVIEAKAKYIHTSFFGFKYASTV